MSLHRFALCLALLALPLAACTTPLASSEAPAEVTLTGFLEAPAVDIAPEIGGRLLAVEVAEGDVVEAGQVLARLDDERWQRQLALSEGNIALAEAHLEQLRAAVRPVDVALAEALVAQAQAGVAAADSALNDAHSWQQRPQMLDLEITQAGAALAEARARAEAARQRAQAADVGAQMWEAITRDLWAGIDVPLPGGGSVTVDAPSDKVNAASYQWNLAGHDAWAAWQASAAAEAEVTRARRALADLRRQRDDNQEAESRVVAAENARAQAEAALLQAQANLQAVQAGPTAAQLQAAAGAVAQARAERAVLAGQLEKTVLVAPGDGLISARYRAPGEVVGPGQRVLTVRDNGPLALTVYAPASLLSNLHVGETLSIRVESAAGRVFQAEIVAVSDEAEFTLRQSQNVAERLASVYAVNLQMLQADRALAAGMPAQAVLPLSLTGD